MKEIKCKNLINKMNLKKKKRKRKINQNLKRKEGVKDGKESSGLFCY